MRQCSGGFSYRYLIHQFFHGKIPGLCSFIIVIWNQCVLFKGWGGRPEGAPRSIRRTVVLALDKGKMNSVQIYVSNFFKSSS